MGNILEPSPRLPLTSWLPQGPREKSLALQRHIPITLLGRYSESPCRLSLPPQTKSTLLGWALTSRMLLQALAWLVSTLGSLRSLRRHPIFHNPHLRSFTGASRRLVVRSHRAISAGRQRQQPCHRNRRGWERRSRPH